MKLHMSVSPKSLMLAMLQSLEVPIIRRAQVELFEKIKTELRKKQISVIVINNHQTIFT